VGYQPDRPLTAAPNDELLSTDVTGDSGVANPNGTRNIDFDVLEVGNGIGVSGYLQTRADWFSLLDQTNAPLPGGPLHFFPGSGVSDSHRNTVEAPGYFRTYVLGVGDDPAALDREAFDAAVLAGRMVPTTGPYIELSVSGGSKGTAGVGDTVVPAGGSLTLHLRVQAANWVPVDEVRVLVNGAVQASFDATTKPKVRKRPKNPFSASAKAVDRFEADVPLPVGDADFYVLAEAGAKLDPMPTPDPDASLVVPDYVALAFTNPVFVDVGGDGFDPPGVSAAATAQALAPLATPAGRAALVMLMGLPGVGKSHCARLIAGRLGAAHLATDHLRSRLFIAASYADEENAAVFGIAEALVDELLAEGHVVVLDATHLVAGNREPAERVARSRGVPVVHVLVTSEDAAVRVRLAERSRERADGDHSDADVLVYERMRARPFEPPAPGYLEVRNGADVLADIDRVVHAVTMG
jgi:predicted kinase